MSEVAEGCEDVCDAECVESAVEDGGAGVDDVGSVRFHAGDCGALRVAHIEQPPGNFSVVFEIQNMSVNFLRVEGFKVEVDHGDGGNGACDAREFTFCGQARENAFADGGGNEFAHRVDLVACGRVGS